MIQWEPENSGIGRQLLDSIYDFKRSNEYGTQQLCRDPFPLINDLISYLKKLFSF